MPQEVKATGIEGGRRDADTAAAPNLSSSPSEEQSSSLQGFVATRDDEQALLGALEKAFDYRGDVTLTLTSGETCTGYIFDRTVGQGLHDSTVRLMLQDDANKRAVSFHDIAKVVFTGRDTAHGKSFDTWVKKYVARKMQAASATSNKGAATT